jgi:hypothetical protein
VVPEDPVHPPGVEAEAAQALLQVGHVVAAQHLGPAEQEAVAQAKTGFDQGVPRLLVADATDPEAAVVLERLDAGPGAGAEDAVIIDRRATRRDGGQSLLQVRYGRTGLPEGQGEDYR